MSSESSSSSRQRFGLPPTVGHLALGGLLAVGFLAVWWIAFLSDLVAVSPHPGLVVNPVLQVVAEVKSFVWFSLSENLMGVLLLGGIIFAYESTAVRTPLDPEAFPHLYQGITVTTGMLVGALSLGATQGATAVAAMMARFYLKIALWILGALWILVREASRPKLQAASP